MAEVNLPVYVHMGETELQVGVLTVEPGVSASVNLDPDALFTARNTITPPDEE